MSEPTARKYRDQGKLPVELRRQRGWRTRPDAFVEVWPEVEKLLRRDSVLGFTPETPTANFLKSIQAAALDPGSPCPLPIASS